MSQITYVVQYQYIMWIHLWIFINIIKRSVIKKIVRALHILFMKKRIGRSLKRDNSPLLEDYLQGQQDVLAL